MATRQSYWQGAKPDMPKAGVACVSYGAWLALMPPVLICACMVIVGITTGRMAGISGAHLLFPYSARLISLTAPCFLIYVFASFARLALKRASDPVPTVLKDLRARAPMLLLPVVILPLFSTSFTTAKAAIPSLVGFHWERFWADADVLLFGDDAWRISHDLLSTNYMGILGRLYGAGWFLTVSLFKINVAIWARPRRASMIYTAMLATWFVGGWFLAYVLSAAGPIYAHLSDPALGQRFAPLREFMDASGGINRVQDYLLNTM